MGIVEFCRNKGAYDFGKFFVIIHKEVWVLPGILLLWGLYWGSMKQMGLFLIETIGRFL